MADQTYDTNGTFTFTVPNGVYSLTVECRGSGGGGGGGDASANGGGGGGGGAYARKCFTVTPGGEYTVVVPLGGDGGAAGADGSDGSSCTFGSTLVVAEGGQKGLTAGTSGGGGSDPGSTGTTTHGGGSGGIGHASGGGGGGGGGASASAVGSTGSNGAGSTGGSGGANGTGDSGHGGAGGNINVVGTGGISLARPAGGAGGGGGGRNKAGGSGAAGICVITYGTANATPSGDPAVSASTGNPNTIRKAVRTAATPTLNTGVRVLTDTWKPSDDSPFAIRLYKYTGCKKADGTTVDLTEAVQATLTYTTNAGAVTNYVALIKYTGSDGNTYYSWSFGMLDGDTLFDEEQGLYTTVTSPTFAGRAGGAGLGTTTSIGLGGIP